MPSGAFPRRLEMSCPRLHFALFRRNNIYWRRNIIIQATCNIILQGICNITLQAMHNKTQPNPAHFPFAPLQCEGLYAFRRREAARRRTDKAAEGPNALPLRRRAADAEAGSSRRQTDESFGRQNGETLLPTGRRGFGEAGSALGLGTGTRQHPRRRAGKARRGRAESVAILCK